VAESNSRRAVVLFNLGGPDSPDAVRPFLFNLFNDQAIIGAPAWIRWAIAALISGRRAKTARQIYGRIGGKSPLLELTRAQAEALQKELADEAGELRVFIAMRYWHPMTEETVAAVRDFDPGEIFLLPLYPQYSTTTSASSLERWRICARKAGLTAPSHAVCCYPTLDGLIESQARLLKRTLDGHPAGRPVRVLFSAHGLPKKIVDKGDPYQVQIELTAAAIADKAGLAEDGWTICYQSRVGPLQWIGPSLDEALAVAARDGAGVAVLPIAFVSEHSETLVELDIEYRGRADRLGIDPYLRVPAVGADGQFIKGLAAIVRAGFATGRGIGPAGPDRICPPGRTACPCAPAKR
jgi:ferrochelatase|tara:strand:- start:2201 stop:3256 length:1056 start_codon:yes stop_codon:yes gene_type:complete